MMQEGTAGLQGAMSADVDRHAQGESDSDDEGQRQKGKKGKRDRGKGQHKVPKRQKGSSSGSFFADLL